MSRMRRRHTANFTTIGNRLFDDERLSADEVGIMAYLLSRPNDWEIRRPALMRRWKIGRDSMRRMIRSWLRTGWLRAEKTRLDNGTFYINYEICDEPGSGLSEDEITKVLSLVSSEPIDESSNEDNPEPVTPHPPLDDPPTAEPPLACYKSLPKTDLPNTDSTKASALWSNLRKAWPSTDILSPLACEKLFAALSPDDRRRAFEAVSPYLANCRARNRKLCDLSTYLKEKRFKGNLAVIAPEIPILGNTPQASRWLDYRISMGQRNDYLHDCWHQGRPWYAPTEWPPPLPASAASPPASPTRQTG